jgi:hypothetical protein
MLLLGVAIGVGGGWYLEQSRSQAVQSEYVRVKVLNYTTASATLDNYTYDFFYSNHPEFPARAVIRIDLEGFGIEKTFTPTQGQAYDILGIEVVVSEVHNDYVILLVKSL